MRKGFRILSSVCVTLMVTVACFGKKENGKVSSIESNSEIEVIDLDNAKQERKLLYSSILERPDVIVLETDSGCVIQNICAIEMYKDHIYVLDDEVPALYVFQADGTFLRRIGHRGRGHGEYLELSDFSIDRKNGVVYLWDDALDMAHRYDLQTYEYLSSVKTERNGYRSYNMQRVDGKLYVSRTSLDVSAENYLLKEIDEKMGIQTASYLRAEDYNKGWIFPLRFQFGFFYSKNSDEPKYIEMFSDTIVSVTKDGIMPYAVVKSKDFVTKEKVGELVRHVEAEGGLGYDLSGLYDGEWVYHVSRFVELDGKVSFQYRKGADRYYLLHDLKTKKSSVSQFFVNDYLCEENNIPLDMCYSDEKGVLSVLRIDFIPYFMESIISSGRLNPDIDDYEKLMGITEDANPVLFYHPYKK